MAPSEVKKIMQDPYPPRIPITNRRVVAALVLKLASIIKAAIKWATVRKIPPMRIVFLGPKILYNFDGSRPNRFEAVTAK